MLLEYLNQGGPVMYGVIGCWLLISTLILDRSLFWLGALIRRPIAYIRRDVRQNVTQRHHAERRLDQEYSNANRNLESLGALSHLATSIGLFGTVLGICQSFVSRGEMAVSDAIAHGLSTALFTTIGGLSVFLLGQIALIIFQGFSESLLRRGHATLDELPVRIET